MEICSSNDRVSSMWKPKILVDLVRGHSTPELFSQPGRSAFILKDLLPKTITCVLSEFSFRKCEEVHLFIAARQRGSELSKVERLQKAGKDR